MPIEKNRHHLGTLQWPHDERDGVSNRRRLDCLLHHLFRHSSKKTSKFRDTGLCEGNSPVTGEFPTQRASNAENVYIWWRRHGLCGDGGNGVTKNLHDTKQKRCCDVMKNHLPWETTYFNGIYFFGFTVHYWLTAVIQSFFVTVTVLPILWATGWVR